VVDERADKYMRIAMDEAEIASKSGNDPFGAVIAYPDGTIAVREHNRVGEMSDPSAHAEIVAIRAACARLRTQRLDGFTLYANARSCPMCLWCSAMVGIAKLYCGAPSVVPAAAGDLVLEIARRAGMELEVISGVMGDEAERQLARLMSP
jgi:tRNA(adenine34) deaminase